ncbi:MAG: hypothetical protein U0997_06545 [Sulfurimicrobium sp.]|nr:hypothetical protein [Sulfurimicrobium sp.]
MKTTCPACGAVTSLDALIGNEAARSLLVMALEQTQTGKRLIRYVALFRPAQRQLSWDRVAGLLGEILDLIKAGKIDRHGRLWAAPEAVWISALDEILARRDEGKLTLPLKSHGYLLEIITGQANKAEARAEQADHDRRAGHTPVGTIASHQTFAPQLVPIQRDPPKPRMSKAAAREKINQVKQQLSKGE